MHGVAIRGLFGELTHERLPVTLFSAEIGKSQDGRIRVWNCGVSQPSKGWIAWKGNFRRSAPKYLRGALCLAIFDF